MFESKKQRSKYNDYSEKLLRFLTSKNPNASNTAWKVSIFRIFLVRIFPHSHWSRPEKLRIRTLFTQCNPFEYFTNKSNFVMKTNALSTNYLKDGFYSLKSNKSPGYDNISYNVIKKCFDSLYESLKYLFNLSVEKSVEKSVPPDNLKK